MIHGHAVIAYDSNDRQNVVPGFKLEMRADAMIPQKSWRLGDSPSLLIPRSRLWSDGESCSTTLEQRHLQRLFRILSGGAPFPDSGDTSCTPSRCTPLKNLQLHIEKEQREKTHNNLYWFVQQCQCYKLYLIIIIFELLFSEVFTFTNMFSE